MRRGTARPARANTTPALSDTTVEERWEEEGKQKQRPMGEWWLTQEGRRQYEGVIYAPGADADITVEGLGGELMPFQRAGVVGEGW